VPSADTTSALALGADPTRKTAAAVRSSVMVRCPCQLQPHTESGHQSHEQWKQTCNSPSDGLRLQRLVPTHNCAHGQETQRDKNATDHETPWTSRPANSGSALRAACNLPDKSAAFGGAHPLDPAESVATFRTRSSPRAHTIPITERAW